MKNIRLITVIAVLAMLAASACRAGEALNLDPFIEQVPGWVQQFRAGDGPGEYSYLPGQKRPDVYGATDMFYLLYTLDMLDLGEADRKAWIRAIGKFQNKNTGWFGGNMTMHSREHATAYAVGAMKLLGSKPRYPLAFKKFYDTREKIFKMLEDTPWDAVWSGSHIPSGIASALINTGEAGPDWTDAYFEWLDREADPGSGYWLRKNDGAQKDSAGTNELGGAFHFYYIYTYLGHPLPFPERIIDATINVQHDNCLYDAEVPYCIDLDGVFSIIEAYKQTGGYRTGDVRDSLECTLDAIVTRLNDPDFLWNNYRDSHKLVGAVVALAELQAFMPEKLVTPKPLKRILALSPFI